VNFDYQVTDRLSLGIGARFSDTEFTNLEIQDGPWSGGFQRIDGQQDDTPTIGKFNMTYDVSDGSMVYFTWAEGFRLGGSNQDFSGNPLCAPDLAAIGGQNPLSFTSDELESFEIGSKNSILGGRATILASVYSIDWTDIQRNVGMPSCLNGYSDNLGEAEIAGIDLEFEMQLSDDWRFSVAWGRNNGEFSEDTIRAGETYALDGQEFEQPKVVTNASVYYNGMINNHDSYLTLSVNYNGAYTRGVPAGVVGYDPNELVIADAESVTVASLRAGMSFGSWSTGFFVENLFDSDDTVGQFLALAPG
jgi:outer membrane receptor protein involved in Fe transport